MAFREASEEERRSMGAYSELISETPSTEKEEYIEMLPDWILKLVSEFRRINR